MAVKDMVCNKDDIWEGEKFFTKVNGKPIIVLNVEGTIKAYQGWCPHQAQSLEDAPLDGCTLTCMAHVWEFDIRTGKGINPKTAKLREFRVEIDEDGNIYVEV
ncbi:Rieske (2Fe-2S) protein [Aneurinibacillus sp. UBA3580]|jgi:toluene monooxygenase system ferredoxin subunit|uniref:Rieske (2Fe-2S) protein n=1 Tax=Aneurinibacillus sp. UBA3580 TaxID=1946041 RepID=UPI00257DD3FE|nr:Rieske 2Fe-2S domain-containing protein [Aneurinibacillus sp. UBA3580]